MLSILCLLALASAEELIGSPTSPTPTPEPLPAPHGYHGKIGVPEAQRIRAEETGRVANSLGSFLGEHKFFAGLLITLTTGDTSVCGGSLVSPTRVVTAAACYYDGYYQASAMLAVLGSVRLFSGGARLPASSVTLHPQYNYRYFQNNIAVLNIPYVVTTSYIRPISMASINLSYAGYTAEIIGFGKTSESSSITTSQGLRDSFVPVLSNEVCAQSYGGLIVGEHVCTGGAGARGACGGDVGGPLILYSNQGNDVLIGVVNFWSANGCASGYPTGHTRVAHHYNWILGQL